MRYKQINYDGEGEHMFYTYLTSLMYSLGEKLVTNMWLPLMQLDQIIMRNPHQTKSLYMFTFKITDSPYKLRGVVTFVLWPSTHMYLVQEHIVQTF